MNNLCCWALFPWFEESGVRQIHAEDLVSLKRLNPYGKVFKVVSIGEPYIRISYGKLEFRVKPLLVRCLDFTENELFEIGETVCVTAKSTEAVISERLWHHKFMSVFYLLSIDGKASPKRVWQAELAPIK